MSCRFAYEKTHRETHGETPSNKFARADHGTLSHLSSITICVEGCSGPTGLEGVWRIALCESEMRFRRDYGRVIEIKFCFWLIVLLMTKSSRIVAN